MIFKKQDFCLEIHLNKVIIKSKEILILGKKNVKSKQKR